MSFLLQLHDALDELWPVAADFADEIDALHASLDLVEDTITVTVKLDDGVSVSATSMWKDDISVLTERLGEAIQAHARDIQTAVTNHQKMVDEMSARHQGLIDAHASVKRLVPSPLEELAQQAE